MLITFRCSTRAGWGSRGDPSGWTSCVLSYEYLSLELSSGYAESVTEAISALSPNSQITPRPTPSARRLRVEFRKQIIRPRHRSGTMQSANALEYRRWTKTWTGYVLLLPRQLKCTKYYLPTIGTSGEGIPHTVYQSQTSPASHCLQARAPPWAIASRLSLDSRSLHF